MIGLQTLQKHRCCSYNIFLIDKAIMGGPPMHWPESATKQHAKIHTSVLQNVSCSVSSGRMVVRKARCSLWLWSIFLQVQFLLEAEGTEYRAVQRDT